LQPLKRNRGQHANVPFGRNGNGGQRKHGRNWQVGPAPLACDIAPINAPDDREDLGVADDSRGNDGGLVLDRHFGKTALRKIRQAVGPLVWQDRASNALRENTDEVLGREQARGVFLIGDYAAELRKKVTKERESQEAADDEESRDALAMREDQRE